MKSMFEMFRDEQDRLSDVVMLLIQRVQLLEEMLEKHEKDHGCRLAAMAEVDNVRA